MSIACFAPVALDFQARYRSGCANCNNLLLEGNLELVPAHIIKLSGIAVDRRCAHQQPQSRSVELERGTLAARIRHPISGKLQHAHVHGHARPGTRYLVPAPRGALVLELGILFH
eukprot:scaffold251961_cov18-Tisochrysis_lutea.AAC.1